MKCSPTTRAAVVPVAAAGVSVLLAGVSYACWSVTGSGTASGAATAVRPVTVSTAAAAGGLHPGASATGTLTISNPNPFPVEISRLAFGSPVAGRAQGTCTTTGVAFTSAVSSSAAVRVPPNGSASVPYTVTMSNASEDGCQGATFTSTVTAGGTS